MQLECESTLVTKHSYRQYLLVCAGALLPHEAVLFDLFDTLLLLEADEIYYTPSLKKLYEVLTKKGVNVPFDEFSSMYFDVRDKFYTESRKSLEEPHFNVRVAQTLKRLGYDSDASDPTVVEATLAFSNEFIRYVHMDPDAPDVLQSLHERYKLGLVSNFAIPECAWSLLEKFDLKRFFDVVIVSGEVNQRKPSSKIFQKALEALEVEASRAIFVGDMPGLDIEGPKNVGMKTVLIKRKPMVEASTVKPDCTIRNLRELLTVLERC